MENRGSEPFGTGGDTHTHTPIPASTFIEFVYQLYEHEGGQGQQNNTYDLCMKQRLVRC